MKKLIIALMLVMSIATSSCIATRSTQQVNKVELGMTKSDIKKLLGTPEYKSANEIGEQWGYRKMLGEIAGPQERLFVVVFDHNGKVVEYNTIDDHRHHRYNNAIM